MSVPARTIRPDTAELRAWWARLRSRLVSVRARETLELRRSEARYRSVIAALEEGIFITDADGVVQSCNASAERILQLRSDQIIGLHPDRYVVNLINQHGEPLLLEESAIVRTLRTGEPQTNRIVGLRRADGSALWLSLNTQPLAYPGGVVASFFDISDYRRALEAESEQRALAEALRDTASVLTSTLDQNEVLDRILHTVSRFVDHDTAEVMLISEGRARVVRMLDRTDDGSGARHHALDLPVDAFPTFQYMMRTGQPIVISSIGGAQDWVEVAEARWVRSYLGAPIRLDGKVIGFLNVNSATSGRFSEADVPKIAAFADQSAIALRNAQLFAALEARVDARTAELQIERQLLQAILDGNGEGIVYSEGPYILYVNPAMAQLSGYATDELIGQMTTVLHSLMPEDSATVFNVDAARLVPGQVWRDEMRLQRKDGRELIAGLTVSCLGMTEAGQPRCVILVRDISQEKALQEQKARFVAHASHELRTPLTNLITRLYLLRRMPERLNEHLAVLDDVTNRMRRLVEDLLDLSRFERGSIDLQREKLTLQALIDHVVHLQDEEARFKAITIETSLPEAPLEIHADRERMHQVLTNLLTNAINYTPPGGEITISAERSEDRRSACIVVQDNGPGIEAAQIDDIFLPFFRVMGETQGSGLGLSIAKELIELHGGCIRVESTPGHGSRFLICLDLA